MERNSDFQKQAQCKAGDVPGCNNVSNVVLTPSYLCVRDGLDESLQSRIRLAFVPPTMIHFHVQPPGFSSSK